MLGFTSRTTLPFNEHFASLSYCGPWKRFWVLFFFQVKKNKQTKIWQVLMSTALVNTDLSTGRSYWQWIYTNALTRNWQFWYLKIKWNEWRAFSIKHNLIKLHIHKYTLIIHNLISSFSLSCRDQACVLEVAVYLVNEFFQFYTHLLNITTF